MSRNLSRVLAVRKVCEGLLAEPEKWSADAIILAKAILALTHDVNRVALWSDQEEDDE